MNRSYGTKRRWEAVTSNSFLPYSQQKPGRFKTPESAPPVLWICPSPPPPRQTELPCISWLEPEARRAIWLSRPKGKHGPGYDLVDQVWWRPCARGTVLGCK